MTPDILRFINKRNTPQREQARRDQVPNSAGGWAFRLDDAARLRRFLILGTEGGTYYTHPLELTRDNAAVVERMCVADPATLLATIRAVSLGGLAPKHQPTLFALAAAASLTDDQHRAEALRMLPEIARTGTHLFLFAGYVEQFRGWGRGLRRAVADWYLRPEIPAVALQTVKYAQRAGWSHRDLLRLSHPNTDDPVRRALFEWIIRGVPVPDVPELRLVTGAERARRAEVGTIASLVEHYPLTWEMLPDAALNDAEVWTALLRKGLPMTALLRQLNRLTRLGVVAPFAEATDRVVARLTDADQVRRARIHPLQVLMAQQTYAAGRGLRGNTEWTPVPQVVDALDEMFRLAFAAVVPTRKRLLLALDVSASMGWGQMAGTPLTPRTATAAMALVTAATEPAHEIVGFSDRLVPLSITPRQRLDDVIRTIRSVPMGGTDCAKPMEYALATGRDVDAFVVFTDNETWAGGQHPHQALARYRERTGIPAKLVVVGMTATGFTIADPDDGGMLDVVGFDASAPAVIADFVRG